jgi:hypothetical protein
MDDEFEWDHDEIVDLDGCEATGDPRLDILGYESPKRRGQNLSGFTASGGDWCSRADEMRAEARQRRAAVQANLDATRQRREQRRQKRHEAPNFRDNVTEVRPRPMPQPVPVEPNIVADRPPGQHGAYFERRLTRRWWAPWKKRTTWTQISTWQHGQPPAGVEVVTVAGVAQLPGQVHTIGRVSGTGAIEY